jgi:hypothetical protein
MQAFSSKKELSGFITRNMPFWVKPTKPSKTTFVNVFTSVHAANEVVEELTNRLWDHLQGQVTEHSDETTAI